MTKEENESGKRPCLCVKWICAMNIGNLIHLKGVIPPLPSHKATSIYLTFMTNGVECKVIKLLR